MPSPTFPSGVTIATFDEGATPVTGAPYSFRLRAGTSGDGMRNVWMTAVVAAAFLSGAGLSAVAAAPLETAAPEGLTTVTLAQTRAFVTASGGVVEKVDDTDDGGFQMKAVYPDKIPVFIDGSVCRGVGEEKRCRELQLSAYFAFDTEAEADRMEHELDITWLSDVRIGSEVQIWRYEFIYGTTRTHLEAVFRTFIDCLWAAHDIVYPKTTDAPGASASG